MKVRELQEQLSKLNPELEVFCGTEDSLLLDIQAVTMTEGELARMADGTPCVKLGRSAASRAMAVLEVTTDF